MDRPVAELITDDGKAPRLRQEGGRWRATAFYRINTGDEMRACGALGLPRWRDPYPGASGIDGADLAIPLWVWTREVYFTHGSDDPQTGVNGWCEARIEYEQPTIVVPPIIGGKFTEVEFTTSSVQVKFGVDADGSNDGLVNEPIAGGQGVSKDVGGVLLHVNVYMLPDQYAALFPRLVDLAWGQKYNADVVTAPPIKGSRSGLDIPIHYAQYVGSAYAFEYGEGGIIRLTHTLKIVPDGQLTRWRRVDELGRARGPLLDTKIYDTANFTGLW